MKVPPSAKRRRSRLRQVFILSCAATGTLHAAVVTHGSHSASRTILVKMRDRVDLRRALPTEVRFDPLRQWLVQAQDCKFSRLVRTGSRNNEGVERARAQGLDRIWRVQLGHGMDAAGEAASLASMVNLVAYAEVDVVGSVASVVPNDPEFPLQWGLRNTGQTIEGQDGVSGADVGATEAWLIHAGTPSVVVAIVDTGVDPHPEFADRLLEGRAMVGDLYDTRDACPHGTHVAGIIGAALDNGEGIAGLYADVRLLPVRVADGCFPTASAVAQGIVWAVDQGADVIAAPVVFGNDPPTLADAIAYAELASVPVIAPVGNDDSNDVMYPAGYDTCLAVSATTNEDLRAAFSNFGEQIDLAAPGQDIYSAWSDGGYAYQSGTSPASAFVAGVAALVRSYAPQLGAAEIRQALLDGADDLGNPLAFGAGRLNARRALEQADAPALRFTHIEPLPTLVTPGRVTPLVIRIADVAEAVEPGAAVLRYRSASPTFLTSPMTSLGNGLFLAELPAVDCEASIEYYFEATGDGNSVVTDPLDAPTDTHVSLAIRYETLFYDDFEQDLGWLSASEGGVGTTGAWARGAPEETSAQPGFDFSPDVGQLCFVTDPVAGASAGAGDVDFGPVRLSSPVIPVNAPDAEVSYAVWFHTVGEGTLDELTVELSGDGGSTWPVVAETVSTTTDGWVEHRFRLSDFPGLTGSLLRVRFSTADDTADSLTEAAIDEFQVRAVFCSAPLGDFDGDGTVGLTDLGYLAGCLVGPNVAYLDSACAAFDSEPDGDIDLTDVQAFQDVFRPAPE